MAPIYSLNPRDKMLQALSAHLKVRNLYISKTRRVFSYRESSILLTLVVGGLCVVRGVIYPLNAGCRWSVCSTGSHLSS